MLPGGIHVRLAYIRIPGPPVIVFLSFCHHFFFNKTIISIKTIYCKKSFNNSFQMSINWGSVQCISTCRHWLSPPSSHCLMWSTPFLLRSKKYRTISQIYISCNIYCFRIFWLILVYRQQGICIWKYFSHI